MCSERLKKQWLMRRKYSAYLRVRHRVISSGGASLRRVALSSSVWMNVI